MESRLVIIAAVLLLAAALGVTALYQPSREPEVTPVSCALTAGACAFETESGSARLELSPSPFSSNKPIQVNLNYPGQAVQKIWLDLQGKEMYMGVNQTTLQPVDEQWSGTLNLGVCTTGTMRWLLRLIVETPQGQRIYQFEFDAR